MGKKSASYEWAPWHDCEHIELTTFRFMKGAADSPIIKEFVAQGWECVVATQKVDGRDRGLWTIHFKRPLDPALKEVPPAADVVQFRRGAVVSPDSKD